MYSCLLKGVISDYLLIRNSSKKWPIYSGYSLLITAYFGSMNCILWIKSSSYQKLNAGGSCKSLPHSGTRTTDTQWRHKSKISEKLGRCGRQNMLPPYLKIWEWEWIFGRAVKAISSLGVRSPCQEVLRERTRHEKTSSLCVSQESIAFGMQLSLHRDLV